MKLDEYGIDPKYFIYAVYQNGMDIFDGTATEIAKRFNQKESYIRWLNSPTAHKRNHLGDDDGIGVFKIEGMH